VDFQFHSFQIGLSKIYLLELKDSFDPQHYVNHLTAVELERYQSFSNEKRKKEFVATRYLKETVLGHQEIKYEDHGAPYINQHEFISISHATNLVGIALNEQHVVGFDIELIQDKVFNLNHKFMNIHEATLFNKDSSEELIACWSMKETLYKLAGTKALDFKKQLIIKSRKESNFSAEIVLKNQKIAVSLQYFRFKDYIISINLGRPIYG
jgi:4'-phosphopantetheinyl transferase